MIKLDFAMGRQLTNIFTLKIPAIKICKLKYHRYGDKKLLLLNNQLLKDL